MKAINEKQTVHVEIRYRSHRKLFQGTTADKKARAFVAKLVKREGNDGEIRWFRWEVQA